METFWNLLKLPLRLLNQLKQVCCMKLLPKKNEIRLTSGSSGRVNGSGLYESWSPRRLAAKPLYLTKQFRCMDTVNPLI